MNVRRVDSRVLNFQGMKSFFWKVYHENVPQIAENTRVNAGHSQKRNHILHEHGKNGIINASLRISVLILGKSPVFCAIRNIGPVGILLRRIILIWYNEFAVKVNGGRKNDSKHQKDGNNETSFCDAKLRPEMKIDFFSLFIILLLRVELIMRL